MTYLAKDTMSRGLISINWKADLDTAYDLMKSSSIRHLPVLNDEKQVVGILSERDLLRAMKSEVTHDSVATLVRAEFSSEDRVKDYMSSPVQAVGMKDNLERVVFKMLNEKISSVVVLDQESELRGIITTDDLIALLLTFLQEDTESKSYPVSKLFESAWLAQPN